MVNAKSQTDPFQGKTIIVSFQKKSDIVKGYFRFTDETKWISFCGLDGFVLLLEEILNQKQARIEPLRGQSSGPHQIELVESYPNSPKIVVVIHLLYRQNFSMQGELCFSNNKAVCFRSALELMFLLREIL